MSFFGTTTSCVIACWTDGIRPEHWARHPVGHTAPPPSAFPCGAKYHLTPHGYPDCEPYVPYYNKPLLLFYPDCSSAAETDSDLSPASHTYVITARDFDQLARWICSSASLCAANWVAPRIILEYNAYCTGSLQLLPIMSLNAAADSVRANVPTMRRKPDRQ